MPSGLWRDPTGARLSVLLHAPCYCQQPLSPRRRARNSNGRITGGARSLQAHDARHRRVHPRSIHVRLDGSIASVTTASLPLPTGANESRLRSADLGVSAPAPASRPATTPKPAARRALNAYPAAAGAWSPSRPLNPAANPASGPSPRSGSIAHEQHAVVTAPIALPVRRRRYPTGNGRTPPRAPSASTSAAKTQILQHATTLPTARTPTKISGHATRSSRQRRPRAIRSFRASP